MLMKQRISSSARIIFIKIRNIFVMRIPIAIRGGFDKKKLPSRSESSENIQLNKLGFAGVNAFHFVRRGRRLDDPL